MTTTRKRLTDEERIAAAQAKADAVKARITEKAERLELATLARSLPALIKRERWDEVSDIARKLAGAAEYHSRGPVSK